MFPRIHWARVTAGLRCAPLRKATYTPAKTARPQPKLISSQPPPSPLLPLRMAVATTPQPRSSSIAVPVTSETKIVEFEISNWILLKGCRQHCREQRNDHLPDQWKTYA